MPLEVVPSSDLTFEEKANLWAFQAPLVKAMKQNDRLAIIVHYVLFGHYSIPLMFQHLERAYCSDDLSCRPCTPFLKWLSSKCPETDWFWRRTFDGYTGIPYPGLSPKSDDQCSVPTVIKLPPRTVPLRKKVLGVSADSKMRLALAMVAFFDTEPQIFCLVQPSTGVVRKSTASPSWSGQPPLSFRFAFSLTADRRCHRR